MMDLGAGNYTISHFPTGYVEKVQTFLCLNRSLGRLAAKNNNEKKPASEKCFAHRHLCCRVGSELMFLLFQGSEYGFHSRYLHPPPPPVPPTTLHNYKTVSGSRLLMFLSHSSRRRLFFLLI